MHQLISNEKESSKKKIHTLESNLKMLIDSLREQPKIEEITNFTLLTTNESIRNRADLSIKALKKEVKFASNTEMMLGPLTRLNEIIDLLIKKQIKISLLITPLEGLETATKVVEQLKQGQSKIVAKGINKGKIKNYIILDRKEVWIATEQKTESGFPGILWTNDMNVVQVYEENFEMNWNNPKAVTVLP
jgi:hypothetical protein